MLVGYLRVSSADELYGAKALACAIILPSKTEFYL